MNSASEAFVPISMFLSVAAVIIVALYLRVQKRKVESTEILAAIEKGVDVKFPEETRSRLLPGLMFLFVGIVMSLALAISLPDDAPSGAWIWGLLPVAVGAAFLIVYMIENKEEVTE